MNAVQVLSVCEHRWSQSRFLPMLCTTVTTPSLVDVLVMKLWCFAMTMICIKESCISVIAIGYVGDIYSVVCLATDVVVDQRI